MGFSEPRFGDKSTGLGSGVRPSFFFLTSFIMTLPLHFSTGLADHRASCATLFQQALTSALTAVLEGTM